LGLAFDLRGWLPIIIGSNDWLIWVGKAEGDRATLPLIRDLRIHKVLDKALRPIQYVAMTGRIVRLGTEDRLTAVGSIDRGTPAAAVRPDNYAIPAMIMRLGSQRLFLEGSGKLAGSTLQYRFVQRGEGGQCGTADRVWCFPLKVPDLIG
jgi:hypothetical protein